MSFMIDDQRLNDLAFLVDITKYLSDLNIKLQGKDQLVHKLCEHIKAFIQKLRLLQKQLVVKKIIHFRMLSTKSTETMNHRK